MRLISTSGPRAALGAVGNILLSMLSFREERSASGSSRISASISSAQLMGALAGAGLLDVAKNSFKLMAFPFPFFFFPEAAILVEYL